ncbi:glucosyltransferase domain-containing protein [Paenibacillus hunanensis]|uniref:glucosyltransferase domain-containing protein n=1 Tax=Paenibacillus hunanensis TaxID=539262 RepID=UPI002A6A17E4|nr:glucosyltransferase domain-containing protein [Paenibacillus hunanensis]WPP42083.1 glucosyltransferase domain-containing protein [Paenibacillus hunanensis]
MATQKNVARTIIFGIIGTLLLYVFLSLILCGRIVMEAPRFSNELAITQSDLKSTLKDFKDNNNVLTATSNDPWIEINFNQTLHPEKIQISISNLSVDSSFAQIYYSNKENDFSEGKYVEYTLRNGMNEISFSDHPSIKSLRLDLTNQTGVSLQVDSAQFVLDPKITLFWIFFLIMFIVYIAILYSIHRSVRSDSTISVTESLFSWSVYRQEYKLFIWSFIIGVLYYLPYITNTLYSIDDYYLDQLYNINIDTLGYNFHSTGRYTQAILAQLFYYMNIQPLTKPLGPLLFIAALSLLGICLTRLLKINSFILSLSIVLLLVTNPFFGEIFHYSIVPAYSAFAVLALAGGVAFGHKYKNNKRFIFGFLSIVFYIISLTTYQIFYPIVFIVFLYNLIMPSTLHISKRKNADMYVEEEPILEKLIPILMYGAAFVIYSILLKIVFFFWPPQLAYSGNNIGQLLYNFTHMPYWISIFGNINRFLLENNPFNSQLINFLLWGIFFTILAAYVTFNGMLAKISLTRLLNVSIRLFILAFIGLVACLGFSLLRPEEISSRSFTAFGLYQAVLLLTVYSIVTILKMKPRYRKILVSAMIIIILVGNIGRIGRSALDQHRLNSMENSLVTRIVERMEANKDFTPNSRLVISGTANLNSISYTTFGDYNVPASQQFSKVFLFNEVTGYSFQQPTPEDIEKANQLLEGMKGWPDQTSIKNENGVFIIKLN